MSVNYFDIKFEYDFTKILTARKLNPGGEVQSYIDEKVLQLSEPYIPKDQNTLIQSGRINTVIGSGEVKWRTAYARRWYYAPKEINFQEAPTRGSYWFERMKQQYKNQIVAGAQRIAKS